MASPTRTDEGPLAAVLLGVSLGLLVGGGLAELLGSSAMANTLWALATVAGLGPAVRWVWASARERRLGVDILAVLALIGTLAVHEYLAGAVISVMLATGRTLEARATARARSDLRALQERAPRVAHRVEGATLTSPPLEEVVAGDLLLVRPGEIVPVDGAARARGRRAGRVGADGRVAAGGAARGDDVRSGAVERRRRRSTCGRPAERPRAPTPASCGWWPRRRRRRPPRRSSGSPTATPWLPGGEPAGRRRGLGALGTSRSGRGGARRGDTLPADPRRADRHHRRALPRRLPRRDHQGRRRPGAPRPGPGAAARQDRHAHCRPTRGHRGRPRRMRAADEILRARGVARPGVAPRRGHRDRPGRPAGAGSRCRCPTASRRCRGVACAAWSSGRVGRGSARPRGSAPGIDPRWATPIRRRAELDGALTVFVGHRRRASGSASCSTTRSAPTPPARSASSAAAASAGSSW